MDTFDLVYLVIWYAVAAVIIGVIVLMILRLAVNYADMNPFSRTALGVRQWSDPLVSPIRRWLARAGLDAKFAPLVTILIAILLGWFALQFVAAVVFTTKGVVVSLQRAAFISVIGYALSGLLAVYTLLIFVRIVLSWGVSYMNPLMRFLVRVTEPVLGPARRLIPPIGMFDISPIVVLFLLRLFQEAIAGTLIR
jgi:YggT family protein